MSLGFVSGRGLRGGGGVFLSSRVFLGRRFYSHKIQNFDNLLSSEAKLRTPSPIRILVGLSKQPGVISLGGGLPADALFPFSEFSVKLKDGQELSLKGELLKEALQYSNTFGLERLVGFLKQMCKSTHNPSYNDWDILITTGSQDALTKAFTTLLDKGDTVITEEPTYSGALAALRPRGINIVGSPSDHNGLIPDELDKLLSQFPTTHAHLKPPKLLYTIPTGQNPSGSTASNAVRRAVYQIARKHNLLILEDDPYWYLRLFPLDPTEKREELVSYFSLDTDNRVIRFDSVSKIISSGMRIGWATGPVSLIEKMQLDQQVTELHASGISQATLFALLEHWGTTGFDAHVQQVQQFYTNKRNIFHQYASKYLSPYCSWQLPSAGMFFWLKVNGVDDTTTLIREKAFKEGVLMLPGNVFCTDPAAPSPFVRASFSLATEEQIELALKRFGSLLAKL